MEARYPRIELRPCRVQDIAAVLALWEGAATSGSVTDHPEAIRKRLERDADLFLLAWDGDRLVGSLIGGWDGWRGNMYRLAVAPDYRRRGIARKLVGAVERRLRLLGAERITALVTKHEEPAKAFWRSVDYVDDAEMGRYAKNIG